jgi:pyrroline-5-carboxylate reductase
VSAAEVIGVIGVGAIAAAIVAGLCDGEARPPAILLSPRNAAIATDLAHRYPTVRVCADNQAVVAGASLVLLCLRPQVAAAALGDLTFQDGQIVVSVMAGVSVATLAPLVAPAREIARAIPLPSVARREGITPIHPPVAAAKDLFDRLGAAIVLSDAAAFEALFAATATIAAHFAYLGAIGRWLESQGIAPEMAERYVAAMFAGIAVSLRGEQDFAHLARDYATPGGLNEQFLAGMTEAGVFAAVERGLLGVRDRLAASR